MFCIYIKDEEQHIFKEELTARDILPAEQFEFREEQWTELKILHLVENAAE